MSTKSGNSGESAAEWAQKVSPSIKSTYASPLIKDPKTLFLNPSVHLSREPFRGRAQYSHQARVHESSPMYSLVRPPSAVDTMDAALYGEQGLPIALDRQQTWLIPSVNVQFRSREHTSLRRSDYGLLLRQLLHHAGIYALSTCMSPLLTLILTPFLAYKLSHTDYGALVIMNASMVFLSGITQVGLGNALFRLYHQEGCSEVQQREELLGIALQLLCVFSLSAVLLLLSIAPYIATILLQNSSYALLVRIAALDILVQNMTVPILSWLRAEGKALRFGLLFSLNVLLNLGATVFFVGVWNMGSRGVLLATGCGYSGVLLCTSPIIYHHMRRRFQLPIACDLLRIGLSMMPALLSAWVLQLADRYLLGFYLPLGQIASYSVAYTLGNVLGPLVITPFSMAWHSIVYAIARQGNAREVFRLIFRWYSLFLLFAAALLSFSAYIVLMWVFPLAYVSSAVIIPLIAFSSACYGMFEIVTVGSLLQRNVCLQLVVLPLAAVLNVLLNVWFIPMWGIMGAAIATLLAYMVLLCSAYCINQRIYMIPFEVKIVGSALIVGLCCYGIDLWLEGHWQFGPAWVIALSLLGSYSCFLALLACSLMKKHTLLSD